MTDVDGYPAGAPCWVDLTCPNQSAAADFYEGLFGWEIRDDYADGFANFTVGEKRVAGIGPGEAGRPASWNVYLNVVKLEPVLANVMRYGGHVVVPPVQVGTDGRGATAMDPTGGVFSLWEAGEFIGSRLTDVPGTWCWTELVTPDVDRAAQFYADVFDWVLDLETIGEFSYAVARFDGRAVAGLVRPPAPVQIRPTWTVSFAVEDVDRSAERAVELGGQIVRPPESLPGLGRYAVLGGVGLEAFTVVARTES